MNTHTTASPRVSERRLRASLLLTYGGALLFIFGIGNYLSGSPPQETMQPAPELTQIDQWINSKGLTLTSLKGKVVVLHFWTFECINCRHNLPYYNKWQSDFARDDVQIIGVHTPETSAEADPKNVSDQVKKLGIE